MEADRKAEVTQLLHAASEGNPDALSQAWPIVYDELKRLAHRQRSSMLLGETLRTTALVHEAYMKLVGSNSNSEFESRSHFFNIAAKAMRSILVDYARARRAQKRGGGWERIPLDEALDVLEERRLDVITLDEALDRLAQVDPRKTQVVELKFFVGLSIEETAALLDISEATVERDWNFSRAWLRRELDASLDDEG